MDVPQEMEVSNDKYKFSDIVKYSISVNPFDRNMEGKEISVDQLKNLISCISKCMLFVFNGGDGHYITSSFEVERLNTMDEPKYCYQLKVRHIESHKQKSTLSSCYVKTGKNSISVFDLIEFIRKDIMCDTYYLYPSLEPLPGVLGLLGVQLRSLITPVIRKLNYILCATYIITIKFFAIVVRLYTYIFVFSFIWFTYNDE